MDTDLLQLPNAVSSSQWPLIQLSKILLTLTLNEQRFKRTVFVLAEWLLQTPVIRSSNPVNGHFQQNIVLTLKKIKKRKSNVKEVRTKKHFKCQLETIFFIQFPKRKKMNHNPFQNLFPKNGFPKMLFEKHFFRECYSEAV